MASGFWPVGGASSLVACVTCAGLRVACRPLGHRLRGGHVGWASMWRGLLGVPPCGIALGACTCASMRHLGVINSGGLLSGMQMSQTAPPLVLGVAPRVQQEANRLGVTPGGRVGVDTLRTLWRRFGVTVANISCKCSNLSIWGTGHSRAVRCPPLPTIPWVGAP